MQFETTAIYPNRIKDKEKLEKLLQIPEFSDNNITFSLATGEPFAKNYIRIVYGDHGPYIEFDHKHIVTNLISKFRNKVNVRNLPDPKYCDYFYYWMVPQVGDKIKVYLQIKPVTNLPNAPKRYDGEKSRFNREEGYADYRRGFYYVDPYDLVVDR